MLDCDKKLLLRPVLLFNRPSTFRNGFILFLSADHGNLVRSRCSSQVFPPPHLRAVVPEASFSSQHSKQLEC